MQPVRFDAADGMSIVGTFHTVPGRPAPAVLLLHSFGTNRSEWAGLVPLLQRSGIAALSFDFRGHGDSTRRLTAAGAESIELKDFRQRDFQDLLLDVEAAASWLAGQPGIDRHRIGVVGSSLGANLALRYATVNEDIAALLLLSPGYNYKGVRTDDVIGKLGPVPLRIVVSRNDAFAFESCNRLVEIRKEAGHGKAENELIRCTGYLHGSEMLAGVKGLAPFLVKWLQTALAPAPAK
jgi:alpha-beta hydrolase superfamily lysophospholipase